MARNIKGYQPDLDRGQNRAGRRSVLEKLKEMCLEQGVNPQDTLTAEDVKKFMNITHAEKNMIQLIATGFPVRNSQSVLRAIELKMERSAPKAQAAADNQAVTVTINTLPQATPPTVTRKAAPVQEYSPPPDMQDLVEEDEEKN